MSFTTAYLLRLSMWGILLAALLGGPAWLSWRQWNRRSGGARASERLRILDRHFLGLVFFPVLAVTSIHLALLGQGAEIVRKPLTQLPGRAPNAESVALTIVVIWFAGISTMLWRLAIEAIRLGRLRREPAAEELVEEVGQLAKQLKCKRKIEVRLAAVSVPQVIGLIRPVLLVPAAFPVFPAAERKAILLHELAHIERDDFARNVFHRLVLGLLWFQPAAWTFYRQITSEREAACDQWAVREGASAAALARALLRLAENLSRPQIAMAAITCGAISARLHRLLDPAKATPPPPSRWWLLRVTVVLSLAAASGIWLSASDEAVADNYMASAFGPVVSIKARDPAGTFGLRIRRGRVIAASLGEAVLAPAKILQRGESVTLLGNGNESVLDFRVHPSGRIEWEGRAARPKS